MAECDCGADDHQLFEAEWYWGNISRYFIFLSLFLSFSQHHCYSTSNFIDVVFLRPL